MALHLVDVNALFLHIPKTGGIWITQALPASGVNVAHLPPIPRVTQRHPLRIHLRESFSFAFSFVRHPLGWYESWWKYQAGTWEDFAPRSWHPQRELKHCASDDFSEFVRKMIEREPAYVTRMYEWYLGPPGYETVDFVGRSERLVDDLVQVLRKLGLEFDEAALRAHPRTNVSEKKHGDPVWDPDLRERIRALDAPTLRRFYPEDVDREDR